MKRRFLVFGLLLYLISACSYLPEPVVDARDVILSENRDYIELKPMDAVSPGKTGFIFYPGGLVDPHAYIGLASRFAASGPGHHVIIVKMPANLAVLGAGSAKNIIGERENLDWVIGGHSLGGAMACSMVQKEPALCKGLVLMAAYSAESVNLSAWTGSVLSITASNDKIMDPDQFESGKARLPVQSQYYDIAGGNHSGFGEYGFQKADGVSTISQEAQQVIIVEQLQKFFSEHGLD